MADCVILFKFWLMIANHRCLVLYLTKYRYNYYAFTIQFSITEKMTLVVGTYSLKNNVVDVHKKLRWFVVEKARKFGITI